MDFPHDLPSAIKLVGLVLSLGLDTFAVAVGLGISGLGRRDRLRFGISFALAEGIMPLAGFFLGHAIASVLGSVASYVAILLLLAVGLYTLREAFEEEEQPAYRAVGTTRLILTALSVSLDELTAGLSLGLLHVPILLAAVLIAVQALGLTLIGTALGRYLGSAVAERAEALSGAALTLLALFLLGQQVTGH